MTAVVRDRDAGFAAQPRRLYLQTGLARAMAARSAPGESLQTMGSRVLRIQRRRWRSRTTVERSAPSPPPLQCIELLKGCEVSQDLALM
jgi:hypothetical protein